MTAATRTHIYEGKSSTEAEGFRALFEAHDPPCISIFIKTEAGSRAADRNSKRLKKLLRTAEGQLSGGPFGSAATFGLFAPALRFDQREKMSPRTEGGIGLFMARGFFRHYILSEKHQDRITIGRYFFVRPILRSLVNDHFFLLALSQDQVKLFQGTAHELNEVYMQGVPESLRQDFEAQSFERESQFHTASPAIVGKQAAIHHGPHLQPKDRILHFFWDVNEGIAARLKGQSAPLVLAAVHYLMPIYHQVNSYPHLLDEGIFGNPDLQKEDPLHAAARVILERHCDHERDSVFKMFTENINTGLTSSNLREVIAAADQGRIRFLLIPDDAEQWGTFDPPNTVHLHARREAGDDELLNIAALLTLRNGGQVFVAPGDLLPVGASLAAVYRF